MRYKVAHAIIINVSSKQFTVVVKGFIGSFNRLVSFGYRCIKIQSSMNSGYDISTALAASKMFMKR